MSAESHSDARSTPRSLQRIYRINKAPKDMKGHGKKSKVGGLVVKELIEWDQRIFPSWSIHHRARNLLLRQQNFFTPSAIFKHPISPPLRGVTLHPSLFRGNFIWTNTLSHPSRAGRTTDWWMEGKQRNILPHPLAKAIVVFDLCRDTHHSEGGFVSDDRCPSCHLHRSCYKS